MPTTFHQAIAESVADTLTEHCERVRGLSEADSRRKQEFAKGAIQELELRVYSHCYGD